MMKNIINVSAWTNLEKVKKKQTFGVKHAS